MNIYSNHHMDLDMDTPKATQAYITKSTEYLVSEFILG